MATFTGTPGDDDGTAAAAQVHFATVAAETTLSTADFLIYG